MASNHDIQECICARCESLRLDAARYRWLKKINPSGVCALAWSNLAACAHREPDPAIDAAIAAPGEQRYPRGAVIDESPKRTESAPRRKVIVATSFFARVLGGVCPYCAQLIGGEHLDNCEIALQETMTPKERDWLGILTHVMPQNWDAAVARHRAEFPDATEPPA